MRDISKLSDSKPFFIHPHEEKRIDLSLSKLISLPQTLLQGTVLSECKPVAGATVKVLSLQFNPLFHTQTNANGFYEFRNVLKPGKYKIVATAIGFELSQVIDFTIVNRKCINISIKRDPLAMRGVIYGTIKDQKTHEFLLNAKISLFKINESAPFSTTVSNVKGEYFIPDVPAGQYQLSVEKADYLPSPSILVLVQNHQLVKTDILLIANKASTLGTISGIIANFNPCLKSGFVALYKIKGATETLLQIKTLNSNNYLFTNVVPGSYIVKAGTKQEVFFQKTSYFLFTYNFKKTMMCVKIEGEIFSTTLKENRAVRNNKKKLIILLTTLAVIVVGAIVWNTFFKTTDLSDETADVQNPNSAADQNGTTQINDAQFEQEMKNRLVKRELSEKKIQVSDPRLANVQKAFSVIEQPYEAPVTDPKDLNKVYRMSIDSFTGAAKYTNGIIIDQDGRVTVRPKGVGVDDFQIVPLVRTLVQEVTDLAGKPYSTDNVFEIMKRLTELQKYVERINLIDFSSVLIEINTYIDHDQASFDKAVQLIKEINKIVNFDKA